MNLKQSIQTFAIAALLVGAGSAFSQAASTAAAPASSAAKKELVTKLVQLQQQDLENIAKMLIQQPLGNLMQRAAGELQNQPAGAKRDATAKAIEGEIRKFVDETVPLMRDRGSKLSATVWPPLLEEKFSEDELKRITAWLEDPVSKKYAQLGGEMQNALAQKLVADTRTTVETRLKALEQTVAKQLGITPPAAPAASAAAKPVKK
jgi:hypothetical protein